jgi:hypothetical protein
MSLRVCIEPSFDIDRTGGVARVVEAQRRFLPQFDIQLVDDVKQAQVYLGHAGNWTTRDDIPRVANVHGLYWTEPPYKWPKWAQIRNAEIGRALVEADMIISPANWVADIIRRDLWTPVNVVPNGIDPELIDAPIIASPSSYVLWNKARINEVCEADSLLALATMAPDRQFVMHPPPARRALPKNLLATGVVTYDKALEIIRSAGVYLATTREVHGVSVLEALACGVPVLGYAWGGQREQLTEPDFVVADRNAYPSPYWQREGILVPPGNLSLLRQGLESLSDPIVWKQASEAAKERSRAFNWQTIMEGLAKDLHDLWQQWPGHRPANSPEISVVIPCYNMVGWLERCLSSVMLQKGAPNYEIILVDDASTDGSYERAMELRDSIRESNGDLVGCQVIKHASNRYLAEALNTGIREARGKWIVNLDPDNELPKDALHNLYRATQKHPELDCVYGLMEVIKDDGSLDTRWPRGIATYPPRTYAYPEQMAHRNQVHSSAMFKRRMWERAGGYRQYAFDDGTRLNSDAEFWTRCGALGFRFGRVLEDSTLRYRLRPDSMSHVVPDWDWTAPSPRLSTVTIGAPGGWIQTHEPIQISVIVDGYAPEGIVESLWPQTFDRWECLVVQSTAAFLPPYAKLVMSDEEAVQRAQGKWIIRLNSAQVSRLEPTALEAFYAAHHESPRGLYDVEDSSLEGKVVMACGGCGGGMRVTRRPGPPISSPMARSRSGGGGSAAEATPRIATRQAQATAGLSGQMTFVDFTGSGFRTRYMHRINPTTRLRFQYVFGNEPDHRRVLVYVEDVPEIIQNTQYRQVPREELTDAELEQLDAINIAASAKVDEPSQVPGSIVITGARGRETFRQEGEPPASPQEPEQELLTVGGKGKAKA